MIQVRWLVSRKELAAMLRRLKQIDMDALAATYRRIANDPHPR
jgi:hypothetical protein